MASVKLNSQSGYTLAELLISGVLLSLTILALITMIQKGRDLQLADSHHRLARIALMNELEKPKYFSSGANYTALTSGIPSFNGEVPIIIDSSGTIPLLGKLNTAFLDPPVDCPNELIVANKCQQVVLTLTWDEIGIQQEIKLDKIWAPY